MKKKGIQIGLATCVLCTQLAGCSSSSLLENSGESVLTSSKADPLEETQTIEVGNIQVQIPADWEEQTDKSGENMLMYSGEYNDVLMEVMFEYKKGGNTGDISEEDREEGIAYLNELMAEIDEDTDGQTFIDADIWEIGSEGQMIAEFNYSIDEDTDSWAQNLNMFSINYGKDNYIISFFSEECESADMDFWEEIIRNISYTELDDEASTTSETEATEESSPVVIAVEPDLDEEEAADRETQKTEIIESNPTTTTETEKDNKSVYWTPEHTLGSVYYKRGKYSFMIYDFERIDPFYTDYDELYEIFYIYVDYTNPAEVSQENVQFEQVPDTHNPDVYVLRSQEAQVNYINNFWSKVPRSPDSFFVGGQLVGIHSVDGAFEVNVTFTSFDETVTFYLPQDYSYKSND